MGFTRTATASTIFIGGCAGLALAPFAGSNVAIMNAAEVGYMEYVLYGPVPWRSHRSSSDCSWFHGCSAAPKKKTTSTTPRNSVLTKTPMIIRTRRATAVFGITL